MPSDINLLQNQLTADSSIKLKGVFEKLEIGLFAAVILALLAGVGLFLLNGASQKNQIRTAEEIEKRKVELASTTSTKRDSVVRTQAQLERVAELLPRHIYWSEVFKKLNNASLAGLQFTQISVTAEDGKVVIGGQAASFNTIAAFTKKLSTEPGVGQVTINSSSLSDTGDRIYYTFSVSAIFDASVFRYPEEE